MASLHIYSTLWIVNVLPLAIWSSAGDPIIYAKPTLDMPKFVLKGRAMTATCTSYIEYGFYALRFTTRHPNDLSGEKSFNDTRRQIALLSSNMQGYLRGGVVDGRTDIKVRHADPAKRISVKFVSAQCVHTNAYGCANSYKPHLFSDQGIAKFVVVVDSPPFVDLKTSTCIGNKKLCQTCNPTERDQVAREIGQFVHLTCTKMLPFPYKSNKPNTFKWMMKRGEDWYVQTSGTTNEKPRGRANNSPQINECSKTENHTSQFSYKVKKTDHKYLEIKCRIEFEHGHLTDIQEKTITICIVDTKITTSTYKIPTSTVATSTDTERIFSAKSRTTTRGASTSRDTSTNRDVSTSRDEERTGAIAVVSSTVVFRTPAISGVISVGPFSRIFLITTALIIAGQQI